MTESSYVQITSRTDDGVIIAIYGPVEESLLKIIKTLAGPMIAESFQTHEKIAEATLVAPPITIFNPESPSL